MKIAFVNLYHEDLYDGKSVKGKPRYPPEVIRSYIKKVGLMQQLEHSHDLRQFRSLNFEELKGDKKGTYSIQLNDQFRLEFRMEKEGITLLEIIIIDQISKHYE
jgi:toxin HigB-1